MITYDEIRTWARWLNAFTAEELADALGGVPIELGERAIRALSWHGIIEDTGVDLESRSGEAARVWEYVPLPPGPNVHPTEPPPEVVIFWEMGGDPLRQPRGVPVPSGRKINGSVVGQRRPGRRQMKREQRIMKLGS